MENKIFKKVLAPMAGLTDVGFRSLARMHGANLTVTEMVSAKGLVYGSKNTEALLAVAENEDPVSVQIFGSEPEIIAECVRHPLLQRFQVIDINMGCPVPKIVKNGEGSALLLDPKKAEAVVLSAVKNTKAAVTVKMRVGWGAGHKFLLADFAKMLEGAGASAIAVHGRTREQFYSGTVDRKKIAEVVNAVKIPVIANGDIKTPSDIAEVLNETGAYSVMIGRGALGNLKIFGKDLGLSNTEMFTAHLNELLARYSPRKAINMIKPHLIRAVKKSLRKTVGECSSILGIKEIICNL